MKKAVLSALVALLIACNPHPDSKTNLCQDEQQSFCQYIHMAADTKSRTVRGELFLPWNELLMAGSAFPGTYRIRVNLFTETISGELLSPGSRTLDESTALLPSLVQSEEGRVSTAIFDLQGTTQSRLRPGLNIIRLPNGTIRKVVVK